MLEKRQKYTLFQNKIKYQKCQYCEDEITFCFLKILSMFTLKWFKNGGIARLIFSEICQGVFSKRQCSLDLKKLLRNVLLFVHLSL